MKRLAYNYQQTFISWDLETEGLNLLLSRPWELGFCVTRNNKIIDEYQAYIWWEDLNISKGAAAVTRFDYNHYKANARPPEEVHNRFQKYIDDPEIIHIGHNLLSFDWLIYRTWAKILGRWDGWRDFQERTFDTMLNSRIYNDGRKPDWDNFYSSQLKEVGKPPRGAKKANLTAMSKSLGITVDESLTHSALYDVYLTGQVANKLIYALDN